MFPMRTTLFLAAALCLAVAAPAQSLRYLGQQHLPTATRFAGIPVGGLSGLDPAPGADRFVALSDDRSVHGPARFYTLRLDLAQFRRSPEPGHAGVHIEAVTPLLDRDGAPFARDTIDPEAIRWLPDGRLAWSNEGQRSEAGFQDPSVRLMHADGRWAQDLAVPDAYRPQGSVRGQALGDRGVRNNLALESLALSPDGRTLWTATENALVQDGPAASLAHGSRSRLLAIDLASGEAVAEYLIEVEPVQLPPQPAAGLATNGLVELLALSEQTFIAVERSFSLGAQTPGQPVTGNSIRLFWVDLRGATNVAGLADTRSATPARKRLLLDLSTLRNDDGSALALDNIEGISWGPAVDGLPTLILVSDNNFNREQFTQFIALQVVGPLIGPQEAPAAD